jgi:hypothetical protein
LISKELEWIEYLVKIQLYTEVPRDTNDGQSNGIILKYCLPEDIDGDETSERVAHPPGTAAEQMVERGWAPPKRIGCNRPALKKGQAVGVTSEEIKRSFTLNWYP